MNNDKCAKSKDKHNMNVMSTRGWEEVVSPEHLYLTVLEVLQSKPAM